MSGAMEIPCMLRNAHQLQKQIATQILKYGVLTGRGEFPWRMVPVIHFLFHEPNSMKPLQE